MRRILVGMVLAACAAAVSATPIGVAATNGSASGITVTGSLSDASAVDAFTFTVTSAGAVTIQSWGYGGTFDGSGAQAYGLNQDEDLAGDVVAGGGFQAALTLYDSSNNLIADSDTAFNGNPQACPPAALDVNFYCGDPQLSLSSLAAGTYTLDIAAEDGSFDLAGVYDPTSLFFVGAGTPDYTVDIQGAVALQQQTPPATTPEPTTWALLGAGVLMLAYWRRRDWAAAR